MTFSENQIKKISKIFRGIFVFIIVLGIIGLVLAIPLSIFLKTNRYGASLLTLFICIAIAYCFNWGLKHRKAWIPPTLTVLWSLTLIFSILSALATQLTFNYQITYYAAVVIRFLLWLVQLFGIYFFAKKEVRKFFNSKGTIVF